MKVVSVAIQENHIDLCGGSSRSAWVVRQLMNALDAGLEPLPVPSAKNRTIKVSMPEGLEARLRALAEARGTALSTLVAGLVAAAVTPPPSPKKEPVLVSGLAARDEDDLSSRLRDILQAPYRDALAALDDGKIVTLEAPTGSGKGRLIAATAVHYARRGRRVIVAAPLAVSYQIIQELDGIEPGSGFLLLGRPNFVDDESLREILDEDPDDAVKAWVASGGKPITPGTQALAQYLGVELAWLVEDLASMRPDFVSGQCLLSEQSTGEAAKTYERLRKHARSPDRKIIVVSHMMLAAHERLLHAQQGQTLDPLVEAEDQDLGAVGLLGSRDLLIIDEAHLLEQAFSAVHSRSVHVNAMRGHARAVAPALEPYWENLQEEIRQELDRRGVDSMLVKESLPRVEEAMQKILDAAAGEKRLTSKRLAGARRHSQMMLSQGILSLRLAKQSHAAHLSLTPRKRYAVITVGRASVSTLLCQCLRRSPSLLTSATIYSATAAGYSADYLLMTLGLSAHKSACQLLPPVDAPWLKDSCAVIVDTRLPPPPKKDEEPDTWHAALADRLAIVYESAIGGVLALCTSYETVGALSRLLAPVIGADSIIEQSPSRSAKACRDAFMALRDQGGRPLWLGVGAAWTGIDLSNPGRPPHEDTMLTDLVICRLPFRVTKTLTHLWRCDRFPQAEILEAVRVFRQGVGRLIRRPGLHNRRLWILDARMEAASNKPFVRVLERTFGPSNLEWRRKDKDRV